MHRKNLTVFLTGLMEIWRKFSYFEIGEMSNEMLPIVVCKNQNSLLNRAGNFKQFYLQCNQNYFRHSRSIISNNYRTYQRSTGWCIAEALLGISLRGVRMLGIPLRGVKMLNIQLKSSVFRSFLLFFKIIGGSIDPPDPL